MPRRLPCSGRGLVALLALMVSALGGGRAAAAETPTRAAPADQACYGDADADAECAPVSGTHGAEAWTAGPVADLVDDRPAATLRAPVPAAIARPVPTRRRGCAGGARAP